MLYKLLMTNFLTQQKFIRLVVVIIIWLHTFIPGKYVYILYLIRLFLSP